MIAQLPEPARQLLKQLLAERLPGREIRVYGSRASGKAKPHSDLDLLILGPPLSLDQRADLTEALRESDLPFSVDVAEAERLDAAFRARILAQAVLL